MASIFTQIINGELPSHKIAEDEKHFAFLDIQPVSMGHVLVVPKKEVDYIFDLPDQDLAELMTFAKQVAKKIRQAIPCNRVSITVIGLEVPHAHVHLIPITKMDDCNFSRPKLNPSQDELARVAELIRKAG